MAIPDYETLMLPLLKSISDGKEKSMKNLVEELSVQFNLSDDQKAELIPSGQMTTIVNRVGWARTYLKKAGLVTSPARGVVKISDRGASVLQSSPSKIDNSFLMQFPEFQEFRSVKKTTEESEPILNSAPPLLQTPEERISVAFSEVNSQLADEILTELQQLSWQRFELVVLDVMIALGYGGNFEGEAERTLDTNDAGIDGIINQDRLGLERIYIQAKRWKDSQSVQRPEIQKFAGALQGKRAKKGIFITTSRFSEGAKAFAVGLDSRVILIDGEELARLMIESGVGVSVKKSYLLKGIDRDYFEA